MDQINRVKYVKILEILKQDSDVDRPMKSTELMAKLRKHGINLDRRTLYTDIKLLNDHGYEILCNRSRQNEYYIVDRQFDIPELRILMDAVESANFISEKRSRELLGKIAGLGGSYRKKLLLRNNSVFNTTKRNNDEVYFTINEIEEAINDNKKISFRYFDLDYKGNKNFRKDGNIYTVNPVVTLCANDRFYLVCFSDKYKNYSNYRIDRMTDIKVLPEEISDNDLVADFDISKYRKEQFGMFSGESQGVTIEFDKDLIEVIYDKFGEKTRIVEKEDKYSATVSVVISNQFFGFIFGLGEKIEILSPLKVVSRFEDFLCKIVGIYKSKDLGAV